MLRHITRPVLGVAVGVPATAVTATIGLIEGDPVLGLAVGVMIAYALAESGYANALYVDRDVLEPVAAGTVQP